MELVFRLGFHMNLFCIGSCKSSSAVNSTYNKDCHSWIN